MVFASYYGQWRVRFVVGTEFNIWRRARVQDNTTSWISRSPTFVSSRKLRRVCANHTTSRALSDCQRASERPSNTRVARRVRRSYDGLAPEAARERGRFFLAGVGSGTVSLATAALFDAERDLRLRVGVTSGS